MQNSIEKYGQDVVIGNILETRETIVHFLQKNGARFDVVKESSTSLDIEATIVNHVIDLHKNRNI
jgi:hypothetical protein